jgi:hypothetical protein
MTYTTNHGNTGFIGYDSDMTFSYGSYGKFDIDYMRFMYSEYTLDTDTTEDQKCLTGWNLRFHDFGN